MTTLTRRTMGVSTLALLAGWSTSKSARGASAAQTATSGPAPTIGTFGVDLAARDISVKPGDDFFHYANGAWLRANQIPADRTRWGSFDMLEEKSDNDVRAIILEAVSAGGSRGTNTQKIADIYNSYLNVEEIDALGIEPIQPQIDEINALASHDQVARAMCTPGANLASPIRILISLDQRDPDRYVVSMTHAGLGLPEREYYRRADGQFPHIRDQYVAHIERMLDLINQHDSAAKAQRIMALETAIAERHWPIADRRDRTRTYNLKTRADIRALDPNYPWDVCFEAQGLSSTSEVVVREVTAMGPLATLFMDTPVSTWREYLMWHLVRNTSVYLARAIDDANFEFFGKTLNGQPQQRERWKRAVDNVNASVGEAVGQLYVARHFPPEAKQQMLTLVENLRRAYGQRIDALSWMSAETKAAAREKLAAFRPKIGYPDRWKDYSSLEIRPRDAFGNAKRTLIWQWNFDLARLGRPSDRDEWRMTPQTVNAYYNATFNEVVFPAAILQPPFFDPNADLAVNYGAIGAVIGHEMGHGFDDQGAKSDAHGVLRDWWNPTDVAAFGQLVAKLAAQYDAFEPLPGIHVNGRLTSGENIGDNGGLQVAHFAYRLAMNGREAPALEGVSADQRFFLGWAQAWRELIRDEALRNQVLTNPHSPAIYRCNGTVRNMASWYPAFDVRAGDRLYLSEDQRVVIW